MEALETAQFSSTTLKNGILKFRPCWEKEGFVEIFRKKKIPHNSSLLKVLIQLSNEELQGFSNFIKEVQETSWAIFNVFKCEFFEINLFSKRVLRHQKFCLCALKFFPAL